MITLCYCVKPGYGEVGVSQGIAAGICSKQVCYVDKRDVIFDLIDNYSDFLLSMITSVRLVVWPSVKVLHMWHSCCNKLHAFLFPARVPFACESQMSDKNATPFDSRSGGVI